MELGWVFPGRRQLIWDDPLYQTKHAAKLGLPQVTATEAAQIIKSTRAFKPAKITKLIRTSKAAKQASSEKNSKRAQIPTKTPERTAVNATKRKRTPSPSPSTEPETPTHSHRLRPRKTKRASPHCTGTAKDPKTNLTPPSVSESPILN